MVELHFVADTELASIRLQRIAADHDDLAELPAADPVLQ